MVQDKLLDGWSVTWSVTAGVIGTEEYGTPITFIRGGTITALRLLRPNTTMETPTRIALWSVTSWGSATLVESIGLAPLGTNTGWFEFSLATPVDVTIGDTYIASIGWNFSHHKAFTNTTLPQPWTIYQRFTDLAYASVAVNTGSMSLTGYSGNTFNVIPVDVVFEPVPYGDFTLAELTEELERWLTAGGDRYPDSIFPERATVQNNTFNLATETLAQSQANHNDLQTANTGITGVQNTLSGWLSGQWTAFLDGWNLTKADWGPAIQHVSDFLNGAADYAGYPPLTVFAKIYDLWARLWTPDVPSLEGGSWELADETDFVDNLLWPVEADVYRVTLSAFDPAGTSEPVGTETRHAYLGKWCPFNVQFSSEWHYFNTASADLSLGGRMPGLGLILYRPGAGHVQAWRRTEAP